MRRRRWALALGGALVLLLVLDPLASRALRGTMLRRVEDSGLFDASIGSVDIGWIRGRVDVHDFSVRARSDGREVLRAPRLRVDWRWRSLAGTPHVRVMVLAPVVRPLVAGSMDLTQREARRRLLDLRPVWIDSFEVRGGRYLAHVQSLGKLELDDLDLVFTDVRNRRVLHGEDVPRMRAHARVAGGTVDIEASGDPLSAAVNLELAIRAQDIPVALAGHGVVVQGIEATGGRGTLKLTSRVRDGRFSGRASAVLRGLDFESTQGGPLGFMKEKLVEGATEIVGSGARDAIERTAEFSGALAKADAPIGEALSAVLSAAVDELLDFLPGGGTEREPAAARKPAPRARRPRRSLDTPHAQD